MNYPRTLYRKPTEGRIPLALLVQSEAEHQAAKANGWKDSVLDINEDAESVPGDSIDEFSPPTRDEIESKARELGIRFNKRTSDEALLDRIESALARG